MLQLERTLFRAAAFGQLIARLSRHIVAAALFLVAWLTEMRVSPAEPLGDGAAEFALELDKFLPVLRTRLGSTSNRNSGAFTAHELFLLEILDIVRCRVTIFHTAEVWIGALKATIVRQLFDSKSLQIVIELVARLL